jgi:hypothetical protein
MTRISLALAAAGSMMLWTASAHASVTLPAATSSAVCTNNMQDPNAIVATTSCLMTGSEAHLSLLPAVQMEGTSGSDGVDTVGSSASVEYFFEITGGSPGTKVPLVIEANLSTSIVDYAGAFGQLHVYPNAASLATFVAAEACQNNAVSTACIGLPAQFSGALNATGFVGALGKVDESILTGAGHGGTAFASADPMIFIDPTFPGAADYTILFSAGVGNSLPAVPEPGVWIMMILGAAAVGSVLRQRRVGRPAPAA